MTDGLFLVPEDSARSDGSRSASWREHARFWHAVLEDGPTRLPRLPVRPVHGVDPGQHRETGRALPEESTRLLLASAAGRPHGLHLLSAAALVSVLYLYTGAGSVTIGQGAPLGSGSGGSGDASLTAVRCTVSGADSFSTVVGRMRVAVFDAYAHQKFDMDVLLRERPPGAAPFDVAIRVEGLHVPLKPDEERAPLVLSIAAPPAGGREVTVTARYRSARYDDLAVARLLRHFTALLSRVSAEPDRALDDFDLLTDEDRALLARCNNTSVAAGPWRTVPEFFAQAVAAHPHAPAVISQAGNLTYQDLDEHANFLAVAIQDRGVRPGEPVALLTDRSPGQIIAVLAILKAGAVYVPIDSSLPPARTAFLLRDSGASLVLTTPHHRTAVPADVPSLDLLVAGAGRRRAAPPGMGIRPADPAYVIYTSGSTGQPKGVVVEHGSVAALLAWTQRAYPLGRGDVILHKTSVSFDVSVWELFGWIAGHAALCLLAPGRERDPESIVDAIERHAVTAIHFVPAMLGPFSDYIGATGAAGRLRTLRRVFSSGDALTPDHVQRFRAALGTAGPDLVNLYGPTETTVHVSHFACDSDAVSIGLPIDNTRLHITDALLRPRPVGIPGELCIAGDSLARGYLGRPELTAQRFVAAPLLGEARVYRTGDLCRRLDDGSVEYLGRIDQQIKVRGYRIEPGEIEHQLRACAGVEDAIVVAARENTENRKLLAYVTGPATLSPDDLIEHLRATLPSYMVPAAVRRLAKFPLAASGKVDRAQLASADG